MDNLTFVRMGWFKKLDSISLEQFRDYWQYEHGPLASSMVGMTKYDQNHSVKPLDIKLGQKLNTQWADGYSKIWFDDEASSGTGNDPELVLKLRADEPLLFSHMVLLNGIEYTHKVPDPDSAFIKIIVLVKRDQSVKAESFVKAWTETNAALVSKLPGLLGYTQDLFTEWTLCDVPNDYIRVPLTYQKMPIDGIAEFYFWSVQSAEAAFASPEGKAVCEHSKSIIAEASSQLIREYRIFKKD